MKKLRDNRAVIDKKFLSKMGMWDLVLVHKWIFFSNTREGAHAHVFINLVGRI